MSRQMKDSGIEWIGEIPKSWRVERNKNCFYCSKDIVGENSSNTQLLSLTTKGVRFKSETDTTGKVPESYDTYQTVAVNDIIMCLFDLDVSAVFSGISPYVGMISPAYKILKCRQNVMPEYVDYWFKYIFDGRKFKHYSKNLRYTLNYDEFAVLPIILPNIEEQEKIASFLDSQCAYIDSIIGKTKASIVNYKNLSVRIIDEVIAKDGSLKEQNYKLRLLGQLKNGINFKEVDGREYVNFLGVGDFKDYLILDSPEQYSKIPFVSDISEDCYLKDGDIVFVRSNGSKDLIGRCVMVQKLNCPTLYSGFCIRFRNEREDIALNEYVLLFFRSERFRELLKAESGGTNINNLSQDVLNMIRIPLPSLEEQRNIIRIIKEQRLHITQIIKAKERFVSELENYKKSMIYEYVTGKKEVI